MLNAIIVDDEISIREGIKLMLDWEDYGINDPTCIQNGVLALEEIEKNKPDLCIVDIRMPVISGLDLIQKVRDLGHDTIFIVLSGHNDFEYAQEAIKLNVFRYLLKPVNADELCEVVASAVEYVKSRREQSAHAERYKTMVGVLLSQQQGDAGGTTELVSIFRDGKEIMLQDKRVKQVVQHISDNIDKGLTLKKLSKVVYLHPNYLSNLFKSETGESIIDYITRVRIEYAKELLQTRRYSIKQVTVMTGYNDPRYFSKIFKNATGVLPSRWQQENRQES